MVYQGFGKHFYMLENGDFLIILNKCKQAYITWFLKTSLTLSSLDSHVSLRPQPRPHQIVNSILLPPDLSSLHLSKMGLGIASFRPDQHRTPGLSVYLPMLANPLLLEQGHQGRKVSQHQCCCIRSCWCLHLLGLLDCYFTVATHQEFELEQEEEDWCDVYVCFG